MSRAGPNFFSKVSHYWNVTCAKGLEVHKLLHCRVTAGSDPNCEVTLSRKQQACCCGQSLLLRQVQSKSQSTQGQLQKPEEFVCAAARPLCPPDAMTNSVIIQGILPFGFQHATESRSGSRISSQRLVESSGDLITISSFRPSNARALLTDIQHLPGGRSSQDPRASRLPSMESLSFAPSDEACQRMNAFTTKLVTAAH